MCFGIHNANSLWYLMKAKSIILSVILLVSYLTNIIFQKDLSLHFFFQFTSFACTGCYLPSYAQRISKDKCTF